MKSKKKGKKKPASSKKTLSPEDESLSASLLQAIKQEQKNHKDIVSSIPNPDVAQALVEGIPAKEGLPMDVLLLLRDLYPQKSVQKAIKKALFKLKNKGIHVPEADDPKAPVFTPTAVDLENPLGFVGAIDGTGSRAVFLALPQVPAGFDVGVGVVGDDLGMIQFYSGMYSKKRMKELQQDFFEQIPTMVETSPNHVFTILETIYERFQEEPEKISSEYLTLRPKLMKHAERLERPAVYDYISESEAYQNHITPSRLDKLFSHPLLETWMIDIEELEKLLAESFWQKSRKLSRAPLFFRKPKKWKGCAR
jgi:hypothetical protein